MSDVLNIQVGDKFPDFTAPVHNGSEFSLSDVLGKRSLVLFFYPRANTGG